MVSCSKGTVEESASQNPTEVLPEKFMYTEVDRGEGGVCYTQLSAGLGYYSILEEPFRLAEMNLQISSDLTYKGRYREYVGEEMVYSTTFADTYYIADGVITLDNLGTAVVGDYLDTSRKILNVTFTKDFYLVPLNGQTYHFDQICSTLSF